MNTWLFCGQALGIKMASRSWMQIRLLKYFWIVLENLELYTDMAVLSRVFFLWKMMLACSGSFQEITAYEVTLLDNDGAALLAWYR